LFDVYACDEYAAKDIVFPDGSRARIDSVQRMND